VDRFTVRTLNEVEVREKYQIKISNRFAALKNQSDSADINRMCEKIKRVKAKSRLKGD
jgi:hypothetical protein